MSTITTGAATYMPAAYPLERSEQAAEDDEVVDAPVELVVDEDLVADGVARHRRRGGDLDLERRQRAERLTGQAHEAGDADDGPAGDDVDDGAAVDGHDWRTGSPPVGLSTP